MSCFRSAKTLAALALIVSQTGCYSTALVYTYEDGAKMSQEERARVCEKLLAAMSVNCNSALNYQNRTGDICREHQHKASDSHYTLRCNYHYGRDRGLPDPGWSSREERERDREKLRELGDWIRAERERQVNGERPTAQRIPETDEQRTEGRPTAQTIPGTEEQRTERLRKLDERIRQLEEAVQRSRAPK